MDYDNEVRKIIEKKITTYWGSKTAIAWDNVKFKPNPAQPFINPVIEGIDTDRISFSCKRKKYILTINVKVPYNSGSTVAIGYANELVQLFEGYAEGGFVCLKGYVARQSIGTVWHQRIAILECQYFTI